MHLPIFQPAQPTTVGKRATLWLHDLTMDLEDLDYLLDSIRLLGSKGTTGTQASFLELFDGDMDRVRKVDSMIAEKMGYKGCLPGIWSDLLPESGQPCGKRSGRDCSERS